MSRLYEYAVWIEEKEDRDGNVTDPARIIIEPTVVIAKDERTVGIKAARQVPDDFTDDQLERLQVSIRPF